MKRLVIVVITLIVISRSISFDALNHTPDSIFYANPQMGEIKLRANKGVVLDAYLLYANKRMKMTLGFQDNKYDYFTADVGRFDTTFSYQILVRSKTDSLMLPQAGVFKYQQAPFIIPEWAHSKIYYRIFPDGFYNANKANDPTNIVSWGKFPDKEYSYGGDLAGIIEKLPYLDSLNFDGLLLEPILSARSNHKYNLRDYAHLDNHFGDTVELKKLINEIHKRNKFIILKFIATHTGSDFPGFLDVIKNGSASKYYNWFIIHSLPIKTSPPNYDCWLNNPQFPKLNLKEPSVQAFLIGYIDYWLHFGFDGIYIGEDPKIDPDFVRVLKTTIKKKYPKIVVLGSSENFGIHGFDGIANKKIVDLLINYFVKNAISTSEFDNELREFLFFTPSQVNLTSLIALSDFNFRIASLTDMKNLLLLYAFLFTFCSSPVVTYGDEIGMKEGTPFNMGSFPWEYEKQDRTLLEEIKKFINIRKNNPILNSKYFFTLYVNDINCVYAYDRGGIITILNCGDNQSYTILPVWNGTYTDLITGEKIIVTTQQLRISLPGRSFKIIKREL